MKNHIQSFFKNELLSYLFFGIATTLISVLSRLVIYQLTHKELLATALANIIGILFAFITNDTIVFKQARQNWPRRLVKFTLARLSTFLLDLFLTFLFVTQFPNIIGQFVNNNIDKVNTIETAISQFLIIILNYIFSKVFIFKKYKIFEHISCMLFLINI